MDNLYGRMGEVIKGNGRMVNKMEEAFLIINKAYSKLEFGAMVKKSDGQSDKYILICQFKLFI